MAIRIVREGASMPVPEDAFRCPNCGHLADGFEIEKKIYTGNELLCQAPLRPIMLPTFDCKRCRCIWQWEADMPKPCPRCGSASVEEVTVTVTAAYPATLFNDKTPPKFAIQCKECGFTGPAAYMISDFVNGWNEIQRDENTDGCLL